MIEVYPGIFVGRVGECPLHSGSLAGNWAVVHAYPVCHRDTLGYTTLLAPDGPEQQVARREQHLLLNMRDTDNPGLYRKEALIDPALAFIDEMRAQEANVLIHCEQGLSRSPSLALLYLATRLGALPSASLAAAEAQFRTLYPRYSPGYGIWAHMQQHWQAYCADGKRA
ncbi:MAG TPA: dual specificity protein phosphatase [Ktedonobacterales bacterium]|nr:dual specificity protein phosphatase [Ktedonobacterales bacterium]